MQCDHHPHRIAVGRCHKCGNRFCVECAEETGQTRLCRDCLAQARQGARGLAAVPVQPGGPVAEGERKEAALAGGPDYDFSELQREVRRTAFTRADQARPAATAPPDRGAGEPALRDAQAGQPSPLPGSMDLDDVLASLAGTAAAPGRAARVRGEYAEAIEDGDIPLAKSQKERLRELREQKKREKEEKRRELADRWDFLSQPRQADDTYVALSKPRAVAFILVMWLLTAFLWAAPNAFLVPQDSEWIIHSVLVGLFVGICFWWKAGKKHSTKLAVQAMLVTVFGLLAGEFLHAFLVVIKEPAFRTIFLDLLSFEFVWENGGTLLDAIIDYMFPVSYLWIIVPPAVVAFLVGYGMPPIPEVFFELGRAVRGKPKTERGHA